MSELITPKKAAELLGVTTATLRNWEIAGKIKSVTTLGKHRRYNVQEIEQLKKATIEK